jgi:hypothetical protein
MGRRLDLHEILKAAAGSSNVYFQPPPSVQMVYPCIVYERDTARSRHADNKPYSVIQRYQVTVIDRDPDSLIPAKVAALPSSTQNRNFVANNLNHDVYTLYY